jgi:serine/threonine protein phosphatase PrpC
MEQDILKQRPEGEIYHPDPTSYLERAFERTIEATSGPNEYHGTTTACGAQLHFKRTNSGESDVAPILYVTNLGDCQVMVLRPSDKSVLFKTKEQWHWFDCPRQLGTNSPDTPRDNATVDVVDIHAGDIVLSMSDGVIDNLWEHEIVEAVVDGVQRWEKRDKSCEAGRMIFVANHLMNAAKAVALDPFAESPYMEHAIEEGLASEGGNLHHRPQHLSWKSDRDQGNSTTSAWWQRDA